MKHIDVRRRLPIPLDVPDRRSFSGDLPQEAEGEASMFLLSVGMVTITMLSYSFDIASSAALAYWLYNPSHWWWWMTVGPLVSSLVVVNCFSIRWYIHDQKEEKEHLPKVTNGHWAMRGLFHGVLLGPLIRYFELFLYGIHVCDGRDPRRHQYRILFLQEDRDVSLLALVGSFIKSAPQLVLQMYILTQNRFPLDAPTTRVQAINLVASLVELSLAQSAYHRASRRFNPLKRPMSKWGVALQFLSHCCVIGSRVMALASFAALYRHWIFVFCGIHWVLMTSWLIMMRTSFCATASGAVRPLEEFIFNVVIGVIYIFCFVNVVDEPTRWKYTIYYIIVLLENVILTSLWFVRADPDLWFRTPLLVTVIASLAIGLAFLAIYYRFLHPNKQRTRPLSLNS